MVVVPLTTTDAGLAVHPRIFPDDDNGLDETSWAMTDQIRAVSPDRITRRRGVLGEAAMEKVEHALMITLKLEHLLKKS